MGLVIGIVGLLIWLFVSFIISNLISRLQDGYWRGSALQVVTAVLCLSITVITGVITFENSILFLVTFVYLIYNLFSTKKLFKRIGESADFRRLYDTYFASIVSVFLSLSVYAFFPIFVYSLSALVFLISAFYYLTKIKKGYGLVVNHILQKGFADPLQIEAEDLKDWDLIKDKKSFIMLTLTDMTTWDNNKAVRIQGKSEIFLLNAVYERIIIGIKEKKSKREIIDDIFKNVNINLPIKCLDIVFTSLNISTVAEYDDFTKNFIIMKYEFSKNPIIKTKDKYYKELYIRAFQHIILDNCTNTLIVEDMFKRAQKEFGVAVPVQVLSEADINLILEELQKKKKGFKAFFKRKENDFKFLLLIESFYIICAIKGHLIYDAINHYSKLLNINSDDTTQLIAFLEAQFMYDKNPEALIKESGNRDIHLAMEYFCTNNYWNRIYYSLPRYNVAVCATMSSGKSTFVNALLGYDYIPSRNQACTAKITTISDNDSLHRIIGYSASVNNSIEYKSYIDRKQLEEWNDNNSIKRIILEGDLEEISSKTGVLVIHDTPGTNYSQDRSHCQETMDFLNTTEIDLIIYLINGEHSSATENHLLLEQVFEICQQHPKTQILFLVNKLDSFDIERGESIKDCLNEVRNDLIGVGYVSPHVLPIIANGARLFKMVLKGAHLTRHEIRDFKSIYNFCMNEQEKCFDATNPNFIGMAYKETNSIQNNNEIIEIDGDTYSKNEIREALKRTGITTVTQILDSKINAWR